MDDVSSEPVIVQARVTLDETVHIPTFSEKEVPVKIDKPLRDGVWVLEGDRSGRLLVSVANALVRTAFPYILVCMINTQCTSVVAFKGTKVGVVEEAYLQVKMDFQSLG